MENSAVEWLVNEFKDTILKEYGESRFLELIDQAKEIENQNLNKAHKVGMELREYEIFDWLKCQDWDSLVEEIIESEEDERR